MPSSGGGRADRAEGASVCHILAFRLVAFSTFAVGGWVGRSPEATLKGKGRPDGPLEDCASLSSPLHAHQQAAVRGRLGKRRCRVNPGPVLPCGGSVGNPA